MDDDGGTGGGIADDDDEAGKGIGAEEREARRALNASFAFAFAVLRALRVDRGGICGTGAGSRMNGLEFERNCVRVGGWI